MSESSKDQADGQAQQTSPVEIFSIGKEQLIGQIQDSNSFWLSQQITKLGGTMQRITILDDHQPSIVAATVDHRDGVDAAAQARDAERREAAVAQHLRIGCEQLGRRRHVPLESALEVRDDRPGRGDR